MTVHWYWPILCTKNAVRKDLSSCHVFSYYPVCAVVFQNCDMVHTHPTTPTEHTNCECFFCSHRTEYNISSVGPHRPISRATGTGLIPAIGIVAYMGKFRNYTNQAAAIKLAAAISEKSWTFQISLPATWWFFHLDTAENFFHKCKFQWEHLRREDERKTAWAWWQTLGIASQRPWMSRLHPFAQTPTGPSPQCEDQECQLPLPLHSKCSESGVAVLNILVQLHVLQSQFCGIFYAVSSTHTQHLCTQRTKLSRSRCHPQNKAESKLYVVPPLSWSWSVLHSSPLVPARGSERNLQT